MRILGISAYYHDSAAALLCDGRIAAAAQEERFTRRKHDPGFPSHAVEYCLSVCSLGLRDLDYVVFYDKPLLKFERLLETYLAFAPAGYRSFRTGIPVWLREKLFQERTLRRELSAFGDGFDFDRRLLFTEHHLSHAASAFFASPFHQAAILTMDGVGEWCTTSLSLGSGNRIEIAKEIHYPHSLGLLYSAFTYYNGFKVNSGEYKLMGLAPYGSPKYAALIKDNLIDIRPDGSFRLDLRYFEYCSGLRMTNGAFDRLFGGRARTPAEPLTERHMDLAASVQSVLEEVVLKLTRSLASETRQENLCLAGGVALNCVANSRILRDGRFKNVWIQPASGDSGGAIGAALAVHHMFSGHSREPAAADLMQGAFLGPSFSECEIEQRLSRCGARFRVMNDAELLDACVEALSSASALGWFQGRMEFGPRALGSRSILADARNPSMQSVLNLKVKRRESFRPFAPSVLREHVREWFELDSDSPYMLLVAPVAAGLRKPVPPEEQALFGIEKLHVQRSAIPAITHVDYSARVQTVHRETNPRYYDLLEAFYQRTGCPVLVNTSFNVRGEPIVCTPEDAFRCFMGTEIDAMAAGNCFLRKQDQDLELKRDQPAFDPD